MTNIAVIKTIEFTPRGSKCCRCVVPFRNGSAAYEAKTSRQPAGDLTRHTLTFKLTPLSDFNNELIYELKRAASIRFEDVNCMEMTLGTEHLPPKIDVEEYIEGKLGEFRGYKVTITWDDHDHIRPVRTCARIHAIHRGESLTFFGKMDFRPGDSIQSLRDVDVTAALATDGSLVIIASSNPSQDAPLAISIEDDHRYSFTIPPETTIRFEPGILKFCLKLTVKSNGVVLATQYDTVEVLDSVYR